MASMVNNLTPCPQPQVCGVSMHKDMANCKALSQIRGGSQASTSFLSNVVSASDESSEKLKKQRALVNNLSSYVEGSFDLVNMGTKEKLSLPFDDDKSYPLYELEHPFGDRRQIATHALRTLIDDADEIEREHPGMDSNEKVELLRKGLHDYAGLNDLDDLGRATMGDDWNEQWLHYDVSDPSKTDEASHVTAYRGLTGYITAYKSLHEEARANILEDYGDDIVDENSLQELKQSTRRLRSDLQSYNQESENIANDGGRNHEEAELDSEAVQDIRDREIRSYYIDPLSLRKV